MTLRNIAVLESRAGPLRRGERRPSARPWRSRGGWRGTTRPCRACSASWSRTIAASATCSASTAGRAEAVRLYRESWAVGGGHPAGRTRTTGSPSRACSACAPGRRSTPGVRPTRRNAPTCRRFGDAAMAAHPPRDRGGIQERRAAPGRRRIRRAPRPRRLPGRPGPGRSGRATASRRRRLRRSGVPSRVAGVHPPRLRVATPTDDRPRPNGRGRQAGRAAAAIAAASGGRAQLEEEQASSQHAIGARPASSWASSRKPAPRSCHALAMRESWCASRPGDARRLVDLAATRAAIGRLDWRLGKLADAIRAWDADPRGPGIRPGRRIRTIRRSPSSSPRMETIVGHSYAEAALWEDAAGGLRPRRRERVARPPRRAQPRQPAGRHRRPRRPEGPCAQHAGRLRQYHRSRVRQSAGVLVRLAPGCVPEPARLVELAERSVAAGHADAAIAIPPRAWPPTGPADSTRPSGRRRNRSPPSRPGRSGCRAARARPSWRWPTIGSARPATPPGSSTRINRLGWDAVERRTEPQDWWPRGRIPDAEARGHRDRHRQAGSRRPRAAPSTRPRLRPARPDRQGGGRVPGGRRRREGFAGPIVTTSPTSAERATRTVGTGEPRMGTVDARRRRSTATSRSRHGSGRGRPPGCRPRLRDIAAGGHRQEPEAHLRRRPPPREPDVKLAGPEGLAVVAGTTE